MTKGYAGRFLFIVLTVASAGILANVRGNFEKVPASKPVQEFPEQLGEWSGRDVALDQETLALLGPGFFLSRMYSAPGKPNTDFFLAYFPSQRQGDTVHSPKNCLPGAGWAPASSTYMDLELAPGHIFNVNRLVVVKGPQQLMVLYWYYAHGRAIASEYAAKLRLVNDAIRMNRTDGGMVRVITPILEGESDDSAQARAVAFAKQIAPKLDDYIPR